MYTVDTELVWNSVWSETDLQCDHLRMLKREGRICQQMGKKQKLLEMTRKLEKMLTNSFEHLTVKLIHFKSCRIIDK